MLSYCRLVYMPMSYLYGKRFVGQITALVLSLRQELYTQPYHQIHWNQARNTFAKVYIHNMYQYHGIVIYKHKRDKCMIRRICTIHIRWCKIWFGGFCSMWQSQFQGVGLFRSCETRPWKQQFNTCITKMKIVDTFALDAQRR